MSVSAFAERLRNAMNSRELKQVDLVHAAERRGVKMGKSHISQYVAGKTMPREDVLLFLADELDVDANWLRGRSSETKLNSDAQPASHIDTPSGTPTSAETEIPAARRRTFGKSHKLDDVLYDVRGPVVDEAARMEQAGTHVLKLNIGNPAPFGFRTPDEVVYDMAQQLSETEGYSASKGLFSARKAIMQYAQLKNIPNVTIEDIYTGNGVSELINLSMSALLDSGDEVLVPSPDYPLWTACVNLAGGTAVHYLCDEKSDWYPDIDDMRKKITDRTVAIVLINPNNPTGALYPKEVLQQIVDLAREHQLMIFSDEIYDRLVMDGLEHISIASMAPDLFCVTFSGLSKSHMIAGYRVGWMILSGNKAIAKDYIEGINMLTNMRICSNVPAQSIVQTALGGHQSVHDYIVPGGRIHDQRDYIYDALNSIPGSGARRGVAFPRHGRCTLGAYGAELADIVEPADGGVLECAGGGADRVLPFQTGHLSVVLPHVGFVQVDVVVVALHGLVVCAHRHSPHPSCSRVNTGPSEQTLSRPSTVSMVHSTQVP